MGEFMKDPVRVLETMEDVRAAMSEDRRAPFGFEGLDAFHIKSVWLISLIDEIESGGRYPYNIDVRILAERRLGLPPKTDREYSAEDSTISLLVYNAQCYRRHDRLIADGFEPLTDEMVTRAHETGHEIETGGKRFRVREIQGNLYAMLPRKRKSCLAVNGQPARLVAA